MRPSLPLLLGGGLMLLAMLGLLLTQPLPASAFDIPAWVQVSRGSGAADLPPITRALPPPPTATPFQPVIAGSAPTGAPSPTPFLPAQGSTSAPVATAEADANAFLAPASEDTRPPGLPPDRLLIPSIGLDAPVVASESDLVWVGDEAFQQWRAPDYFAAGWQTSSAGLGQPGNTVLDGHHNINGLVFAHLVDVQVGDTIQVRSGEQVFTYTVTDRMILPERDQPLDVRLANAARLQPTEDERLTLVTCWPWDSNTHRLILVAKPSD